MLTKFQRIIKLFAFRIIEVFKPRYTTWGLEDKSRENVNNVPEEEQDARGVKIPPAFNEEPDTVSLDPFLESKNHEISALKAQIERMEIEMKENQQYKGALSKIKEAIVSSTPLSNKVGRPPKGRVKRTVKVDLVLLVIYNYARTIGLYDGDFSSILNESLYAYLSQRYPAAYIIYDEALKEIGQPP